MKTYFFIRNSIVVLLAWLTLLGWSVSHTAAASVEFQLIQSMGKREGTPYGKLIEDPEGNYYGTTYYGGSNGAGTVFKIDSSGNFSVLHEFDGAGGGANPYAGLLLARDGYFYGTTYAGGGSNAGIVFKINSSKNFIVLHEFDGDGGGANPYASLIQGSDGYFYGTTMTGGISGFGTVFGLDSAGNFSVLHEFNGTDGAFPYAELVQASDGSFYGTTGSGGIQDDGTIFKLDPSGDFSIRYEFDGATGVANPNTGLIQGSDGSFYGATNGGYGGTIYKLDASGDFSILHSFDYGINSAPSSLTQGPDGHFYGTTMTGGISGFGTVFELDSAGNFSVLHEFDYERGAWPYGVIQANDGSFYGTTNDGGSNSTGTVFKLDGSGNFTLLHTFDKAMGSGVKLIQGSDGNFYGTTWDGGIGFGTLFKLDAAGNTDILYEFEATEDLSSANPSNLIQGTDASFYGTTERGGSNGFGTIFKLDPSGSFSILHSFDSTDGSGPTNLIQGHDGLFYGTTAGGGGNGGGTFFKIDPSGNFNVLQEFWPNLGGYIKSGMFQGSDGSFYGINTFGGNYVWYGTVIKLDSSGIMSVLYSFGDDGSYGYAAGLIQGGDSNLYGTTYHGGSLGFGKVFKLDLSGNFSVLHNFDGDSGGANPSYGLIQTDDGNFYGTTLGGGSNDAGTIFKLDTSDNFSIVYDFDGQANGGNPGAGLFKGNDGNIYGITSSGGQYGGGTFFRLIDSPIALESSANPSLRGQRVTFTATVTGNSPTGSVRFLKGTKSLGSVPLIGGVARLSTSRLKIGSHSITAVYSGDANNASVTSAPLVQVIRAATKKEPRARPRGNWGQGNR